MNATAAPCPIEPTPALIAARGTHAIHAYARLRQLQGEEDYFDRHGRAGTLRDLLADLIACCHADGLDFGEILEAARERPRPHRRFEVVPAAFRQGSYEVVEVGSEPRSGTGRRPTVFGPAESSWAETICEMKNRLAAAGPVVSAWSAWPPARPACHQAVSICLMANGDEEPMTSAAVAGFIAYWGAADGLIGEGRACRHCGEPKEPGTFCHGNDQCTHGPGGTADECCRNWGRYCCRCGSDYALGQM